MATAAFQGVGKVYPDGTRAVESLDLEIGDGEFMVLVGPSGCGKTTALRMVAGLEDVTEGTITIGDAVVNDLEPRERDVAMVFQNFALYPSMTVYENIEFPLKLAKQPRAQRAESVREIARTLRLEQHLHRKPRHLSGGQRQRVAMGRAIVREPRAFLMDEPLSNLDAKLRVQMRTEIARIQKKLGVATIYVTHDQVEAMTLGDRVAVMRGGRLQQVADPQTLYEHPTNLFVAGFVGSPSMNLVEGRVVTGGKVAFGEQSLDLRATTHTSAANGRAVVAGIRPELLEDGALATGGARLRGRVTLREALGSDVLVHFTVDGARQLTPEVRDLAHDVEDAAELEELTLDGADVTFIGRFDPATRAQEGERIEVAVKPGAVQLFDRESGRAIA